MCSSLSCAGQHRHVQTVWAAADQQWNRHTCSAAAAWFSEFKPDLMDWFKENINSIE